MSVKEFRLSLEKFVQEGIEEKIGDITRHFGLQGLSRVVKRSPVDEGTFRGNWTVSIDRPDYTATENKDKDGGPTIAKGSEIIAAVKPFQVIWIQNNLPYAVALEYGHSKQAPTGVVGVTVAELEVMLS